jgi:phosphotransferase system enzyme I (PtsI)
MLLALGIEELSMHPGSILTVRKAIRAIDHAQLLQSGRALSRAVDREAISRWMARHTG